jgi:hypothetical protein
LWFFGIIVSRFITCQKKSVDTALVFNLYFRSRSSCFQEIEFAVKSPENRNAYKFRSFLFAILPRTHRFFLSGRFLPNKFRNSRFPESEPSTLIENSPKNMESGHNKNVANYRTIILTGFGAEYASSQDFITRVPMQTYLAQCQNALRLETNLVLHLTEKKNYRALPADVRKVSDFPAKVSPNSLRLCLCLAAGNARHSLDKELITGRKGTAFPQIERQSRKYFQTA